MGYGICAWDRGMVAMLPRYKLMASAMEDITQVLIASGRAWVLPQWIAPYCPKVDIPDTRDVLLNGLPSLDEIDEILRTRNGQG